jgi:hypothetical protein
MQLAVGLDGRAVVPGVQKSGMPDRDTVFVNVFE